MASNGQPVRNCVAPTVPVSNSASGIVLRLLIYIVLVTTSVVFVLRYANKIKGNPDSS